jgi:hypothetical protein
MELPRSQCRGVVGLPMIVLALVIGKGSGNVDELKRPPKHVADNAPLPPPPLPYSFSPPPPSARHQWRTRVVGGGGGRWRLLDGRGQLDSSSVCLRWQGGKKTMTAVGDVEVKGEGSNAINYSLSSFIILWLGKASKSCKYFQEVPRKSPRSTQEVLSQL